MIFKTVRCVWVKRFYTDTLLFFLPCLGQLLLWKHCICHYIALSEKRKRMRLSALYILRFYWMLMDMYLPKFDINKGTKAPNCFISHTNSWYPDFYFFKILSDVRFEVHLARRNIVFIGQSLRALKNIYLGMTRKASEFMLN